MATKFFITKNEFLSTNVEGFYHQEYTGYRQPGNPNFINVLKNQFRDENFQDLDHAKEEVAEIIRVDLKEIMSTIGLKKFLCICVPRSKAYNSYKESQLKFLRAVQIGIGKINGAIDGTDSVQRFKDTYTTHLDNATKNGRIKNNDGTKPYPGVTRDTCHIDEYDIRNQDIILVDDIYTRTINIDEDCIQALIDAGARRVIFYCIGYTQR